MCTTSLKSKIISPGAQKLTAVSVALRCDFHEVMIDGIIASVSADSISISMTTVVSAMTSKLLTTQMSQRCNVIERVVTRRGMNAGCHSTGHGVCNGVDFVIGGDMETHASYMNQQ